MAQAHLQLTRPLRQRVHHLHTKLKLQRHSNDSLFLQNANDDTEKLCVIQAISSVLSKMKRSATDLRHSADDLCVRQQCL